jgi:hypothetical protein
VSRVHLPSFRSPTNKKTKAQTLLEEIERRGGMTTMECMRFAAKQAGHEDWETKRSFWGDYLFGPSWRGYGILPSFCTRMEGRKWVVTETIQPPWRKRVKTDSYKRNKLLRNIEHAARIAKWPACPHCGEKYSKSRFRQASTPTKDACYRLWTSYQTDCKGRVWVTWILDQNTQVYRLTNCTSEQAEELYQDIWRLVPYGDRDAEFRKRVEQNFVGDEIVVRLPKPRRNYLEYARRVRS